MKFRVLGWEGIQFVSLNKLKEYLHLVKLNCDFKAMCMTLFKSLRNYKRRDKGSLIQTR